MIENVISFVNMKDGITIFGYDENGKVCNLEDVKNNVTIPEGVYVRLEAITQNVNKDIVRQVIGKSSNIAFENNVCTIQDLTFSYVEWAFKEKGLSFGRDNMKNLGILNEDDMYTNLGLLISDQCPYMIKMAVYHDNKKKELVDSFETSVGSVLQQLDDATKYLNLNNKISARIIDMEKVDSSEYNTEVLRECLVNSIVHRDYEIQGNTRIHILKDSMEFLNLGGLVGELTVEDIKMGCEANRNPKLMNIFYKLGLVEACGNGVSKIVEEYNSCDEKPEIRVAPHSFFIKIPKVNMEEKYQVIIDYLKVMRGITREDVENLLGVKRQKAVDVLNEMIESGIVVKEGRARSIVYKLK